MTPGAYKRLRLVAAAIVALANFGVAYAESESRWSASWAAAPHRHRVVSPPRFENQTLRQVIRIAHGGERLRVRLSNRYGTDPVSIARASVARYLDDGEIDATTDRALHFQGAAGVTLHAGIESTSDPVAITVEDGAELAVSLYINRPAVAATYHRRAFQTSFVAIGDMVDAARLADPIEIQSWYWLSGIDVERRPPPDAVVAAIGDSTTDGFGLRVRAYEKWSSVLQQRFFDEPDSSVSIVNVGVGGNRLLHGLPGFGESMLLRLERDALALPGVSAILVLIGINDLGLPLTPPEVLRLPESVRAERVGLSDLIDGLKEVARQCLEGDVKLVLATLPPFEGAAYYSAEGESTRQQLNAWIREADGLAGVVDFDAALRDPTQPTRLNPLFDSGDHLHPNALGHRVMANAVNVDLFVGPSPPN